MIKKTATKLVLAPLLALLSIIALAQPSQAVTSRYWYASMGTSTPGIQQTNLWYKSDVLGPGSQSPGYGAYIDNIQYSWQMMDPPPAGLIYTVYLCINNGATCAVVSPTNASVQSASGTTTVFKGKDPGWDTTDLRYWVRINAPTTYVFKPQAKYSSAFSVQVNYTY